MKKYKTFYLKKTGLPSLDNLLLGLLELSEEKRLSITQYINHPFFKENPFYLNQLIIEAKKNKKNNNFTDKIQKETYIPEAYIDNRIIEEAYIDNLKETAFLDKKIEKPYNDIFQDLDELESINIADYATILLNIMEIPNAYAKETKVIKREKLIKIANILYYNESIQEYLIEIEEDSYYFEKKTSGAFILCTNIFSFNLVLEEIKKYNSEKDKRVLFNLIVPGSQFQKVMNNLIKFKYEDIFLNICIYCINIEKYSNLCKQYKKIYGVYNDREQILKFIENISSDKIRVFPTTKVITYNEYKDKYYERHEKISEFYGDLTKETYKKYSSKLANYIYSADEEELGETNKDDLIESFKTFDIKKDLKKLHSLIIKEYTKCNIYIPLNKWLRTFKEGVYEIIAYYTARLIYALNCYGKSSNSFLKKNLILFRGESVNYINALPFERLKGKIILFSGFTSTSEDYQIAENYSNRKISEKAFKEKHKFSVIYKIHNYIKSNCIYCGIDIHKLSEFEDEKEILFQPFSFYFVKNVIFNYDKYTVDIDLEIIPKKEILEKKIRNKEKVIYNKEEKIMAIEEKQIEKTIQKKEIKSQEENNCKII